jgi:hypothetical protein
MDIQQMLAHRDTVYLEWADPWPGIDAEEDGVTCRVSSRATVADCLNMARYSAVCNDLKVPSDEKDLLLDFIATMWAEPVEDPHE